VAIKALNDDVPDPRNDVHYGLLVAPGLTSSHLDHWRASERWAVRGAAPLFERV
jgi:hypothetical protein